MDIKQSHSHYIEAIIKDLKTAGMSEKDIMVTIETMLLLIEDDVVVELLGSLDEENYARLLEMQDDGASTDEIIMAADVEVEDIDEIIERKLQEYVSNLEANATSLQSNLLALA